jgi:hypothetical protein
MSRLETILISVIISCVVGMALCVIEACRPKQNQR